MCRRTIGSAELFTPPEWQGARLLEINKLVNGWHDPAITPGAIEAIGDPPDCPQSSHSQLFCVSLVYRTGDLAKDLTRGLAACKFVFQCSDRRRDQTGVYKWPGFRLTPRGVRQYEHSDIPVRPNGLHWEVWELGRSFAGCDLRNARNGLKRQKLVGMGQEALLIAALHPSWVLSMDGHDVPFLDLPGLAVACHGRGEFDCAGTLARGREEALELHVCTENTSHPCFGAGWRLTPPTSR